MNSVVRQLSSLLRGQNQVFDLLKPSVQQIPQQLQQCRGIRVKVLRGDINQALSYMQRIMQSSGMERLIKQEQRHHIKNSEKRVLARKNLERKIKSQELARKLKAILVKKVRGL